MRVILAALVTAAAATAAAQPTSDGPAPPLTELVERAWAIWRQTGIEQARSAEIDARALANRSLFAGAPSVGADLRRDLPRWAGLPGTGTGPERGRNELDVGGSAPIWLPGQREAQRRVLEREREALSAATVLERLRVAGQVREAVWAVSLARAELRVQQARLGTAAALEADVARRVAAGDLARFDRLLAQGEMLAAAAAVRDAQARQSLAAAQLAQLTGIEDPGDAAEPPAPDIEPDTHPALAAARETVAASRARLEYARATRRDNPTVGAAARFDRDTYTSGYRNTVRVGLSVPLDTEARNAPRLAAASAELTEAEIALQREMRARQAETGRARLALEAARSAVELNTQRATVARDALAAIERAFAAGERGLPEVLRVRAQVLEAELARDTAREQMGLAIARLNQARGFQP